MRQLVVSDFHLDPTEPARYRAAMASINRCPCDQLILAGDIFDAWVGDDNASPLDEEFLDFCGNVGADTQFNEAFAWSTGLPNPRLLSSMVTNVAPSIMTIKPLSRKFETHPG